MRRLPSWAGVLLAAAASLVFAKPRADKFSAFHTLAQSSSPLKLDDGFFNDIATPPRNYSAAIMLTALQPQYNCQLCREVRPEWELLARSWAKGDKKGAARMLFGTLDFANGKETFQRLMLNSAPVLMFLHPTVGPNAKPETPPLRFDFSTGAKSAESMNAWISRQLPAGPRPAIVRPINYTRVAVFATTILGIITFLSAAYPIIIPLVQNRNVWAAISLIAILLFTSGQMFNHIRKVPYIGGDGKNGISYFAGGFSNQFGLETQIIAAIYGVLSFATIALALKVPRLADPVMQQVAVFAWGAIMLGMYSFLMNLFRIKNGGYPFWLPPF